MLTEKERILLLMYRGFGDRVRSYQEVADLFNTTYPDRNPISKSTVRYTVTRFFQTGTVTDRSRSGRPKSATNDDMSLDVLLSFQDNPHLSVPRAAQAHDISQDSIVKILKRHKYHPYKIVITQELMEDDFDRRIQFCEEMMNQMGDNFLNFIVFSDEAMFQINGAVNRHNCRYWSDENPHWMSDLRSQYPRKLIVWAGFCSRGIIGPFFVDGNLNAEKYENLLRDHIIPDIQNKFGADMQHVWFQQDGAPPHYARRNREFLNRVFPGRWIGRRGVIEWPARSPDLSPLDFFLWGHLKNRVYATKPCNLEDLSNRILREASLITLEQINDVLNNFYERLGHCQLVEGRQFEHLIT